jgi:hypothetical protein
MDLVRRAKNIILSPKTEWDIIRNESTEARDVIVRYVLPLAAIAAAAVFIGYWLIGINAVFMRMGGLRWGLYYGLTVLIQDILAVIVAAYVVDALAPSFGSEKDIRRSMQLTGYPYTPVLVGGFLSIIPSISIIGSLFGLYGIYLWYLGLTPMKNTVEDKRTGYLIVSILVLIVVYIVIGWILGMIFMSVFGLNMLPMKGI